MNFHEKMYIPRLGSRKNDIRHHGTIPSRCEFIFLLLNLLAMNPSMING